MIAPIVLLVVVVLYRVVLGIIGSGDMTWLHNFAPVAAVALCGGLFLPRRIAFALPLAMLFLSDLVLNLVHYHLPMLTWDIVPRYVAIALVVWLGFSLRGKVQLWGTLTASLVGSLFFYAISNTGSWLADPGYAKTFAGWVQALTVGLPGYPPTIWFYRHTLVSDLLFTLLFFACVHLSRREPGTSASAGALSPR